MGASGSSPSSEEVRYESFSEDDDDGLETSRSQSTLEIAEQAILAELLSSLIDITAGPPQWSRSALLGKPVMLDLVVSSDESLLSAAGAALLASPDPDQQHTD